MKPQPSPADKTSIPQVGRGSLVGRGSCRALIYRYSSGRRIDKKSGLGRSLALPAGGVEFFQAGSRRVFIRSWMAWFGLYLLFSGVLCWAGEKPSSSSTESQGQLRSGDFEQADPSDPAKPLGWDQPDGLGVQWVMAPSVPGDPAHGKAIRLNTAISEKAMVAQWRKMGLQQWNIPQPADNPVAETYGLSYYSVAMPVQPGQAYRLTFDFKGASGAKVWVRGWGLINGVKRRRYETIVNSRDTGNHWKTFSQVFHPTASRPEVTEMRVMLFAYHPAGIYWFDNVRIEPVNDERKATAEP